MVVDGSKVETMTEQQAIIKDQISSDDIAALAADYLKNMGNGKKNLLCGDYPEAVACFQLACSQQSERFGETSHECAESFHYYGKALLELARMENGVLGNALKGVPETEDESESEVEEPQFEKPNIPAEERQEIRKEVEDAMKETEKESEDNQATDDEAEAAAENAVKKSEENKDTSEVEKNGKKGEANEVKSSDKKGGEVEKDEKKDEGKDEKQENAKKDESKTKDEDVAMDTEITNESKNGTSTAKSADVGTSSSNGSTAADTEAAKGDEETNENEDDDEDPDDIPNMQLAWEMLELSKVLYSKKPSDKQNKLMIANCHLKLGELGLEVENYAQAIGDFLECLVIRKELLDSFDRSLAETHYQLGLAYAFDKRYENALEHYNNALEVLDSRIEHLNKIIDDKDREQKDDTAEPHPECTEIGEIKALIPDINSKIEDVEVMKRQDSKFAGSPFRSSDGAGCSSSSSTTTIGFAAPSTPTDKVCTVIPIKRKEDEKSEDKKKSTENGSSATNDITHLVRRKRASDNDEATGAAETKKIKTVVESEKVTSDTTDAAAENGADKKKNGTETEKPAENGEAVAMEA